MIFLVTAGLFLHCLPVSSFHPSFPPSLLHIPVQIYIRIPHLRPRDFHPPHQQPQGCPLSGPSSLLAFRPHRRHFCISNEVRRFESEEESQELVFSLGGEEGRDGIRKEDTVGTFPTPSFIWRRFALISEMGLARVAVWEMGQGLLESFPMLW